MVHHSFASAITNIINIGMIFAPCIGYMTQALKFKNKKSSTGFSLCICLVLIISNVLRIYFWFGRQFTVVLLFQSLIVILSQMYLIKVYLDYKEFHIAEKIEEEKKSYIRKIVEDLGNLDKFWKWDEFVPFLISIINIFIVLGLISYFCGFDNVSYVEFIGYLSTGIEVLLGVPQIITNYKGKNVETLSFIMFLTWILGDCFKTGYYYFTRCPFQFILCGIIQIIVDFILIGQIWYYNKGSYLEIIAGEFVKKDEKSSVEKVKKEIENIVKSSGEYGTIEEENTSKSEENLSLLISSEL